jgi:hypothetical protein
VKMHTGYSGDRWRGVVECLRPGYYWVSNQPVTGAAPKDFIYVYEHGPGVRRAKPQSWPAYIAKVGNKWYPSESVTEQLMTRIGEQMGIRMASSKLMYSGDQIRFLSRYFLKSDEMLVHGAEILAGYLEDTAFVKNVADQHRESELFTFQVLHEAIYTRFPDDEGHILCDFARMIAFDALAGNQDRHLYNWGVIVHPTFAGAPRFSPIYDSARGLFWNTPEVNLSRFETDGALRRYILGAHPLIGWDPRGAVGHFELVANIAGYSRELRDALNAIDLERLGSIELLIDREFSRLFSEERRDLIKRCLRLRFEMFADAVSGK